MFERNSIRVLHLETTTVCNASCPQCFREDPEMYNDSVNRASLSVEQIKELFSESFIHQLDKVFACGQYGDPAAARETLNIFDYFRSINTNITLGMNTNGSVQSTDWWSKLGSLLSNKYDYCVFSIDGLEDTNHIYRQGTSFQKILNNASAFIDAGGNAHWDMLVFKHNEHQVDEAMQIAQEYGFKHFRTKVSKRFDTIPVDGILPPSSYKKTKTSVTHIDCFAGKERSLYVSATGRIMPCCWIGARVFTMDETLELLLDSDNYDKLVDSWDNLPHEICSRVCGVSNNTTAFENQWKQDISL